MAPQGFAEGRPGIPSGEIPAGRMRIEAAQLLKNGLLFSTKVMSLSQTGLTGHSRALQHPKGKAKEKTKGRTKKTTPGFVTPKRKRTKEIRRKNNTV